MTIDNEEEIRLDNCPFCEGKVVAYWKPYERYEGDGKGDHIGETWPRHSDIQNGRHCNRAMYGYHFSAKTKEEAIDQLKKAWNIQQKAKDTAGHLAIRRYNLLGEIYAMIEDELIYNGKQAEANKAEANKAEANKAEANKAEAIDELIDFLKDVTKE